jgi:CSLREA domain-containing protein
VQDSLLEANFNPFSPGRGGGIYNAGALSIRNSTLSQNSSDEGGGIYNASGGSASLDSVTITLSFAADGGGIFNAAASPVALTNTLVAGNSLRDGVTNRSQLAGNFSGSYNLVSIGDGGSGLAHGTDNNRVGTASTPIDARLGPLATNYGMVPTHALLFDSPAVNAGSTTLTADQRGVARPQGDRDDIGAFEFDAFVPSLVVTTTADEDDGTSDARFGAGTSLREALHRANADGTNSAITFGATAFAAPRKTITLTANLPGILPNGTLSITAPSEGVTISGNNARRVLVVESGANATFTGLTIANGSASDGAGILNRGALSLLTSVLSDNHASNGGGIYNDAGASLSIESSTLRDNDATPSFGKGGGIYNAGNLAVKNSSFGGNGASFAAAIYNAAAPNRNVTFDSATLANNTAGTAAASLTIPYRDRAHQHPHCGKPTPAAGANRSQIAGSFSGSYNLVSIATAAAA